MLNHLLLLLLLTVSALCVVNSSEATEPDYSGIWKTSYVSLDDPRWTVTDLACSGWCSLSAYNYLQTLLTKPENDARAIKELLNEAQEYGKQQASALLTPLARKKQSEYSPANDPALDCSPEGDGLRHQITAPLPIEIKRHADSLSIHYEYWNAVRTVYMDGRGHPEGGASTRLGHSIGWYEDGQLIIETAQLLPGLISLPGGYIKNSPDARLIERYTRSGDRLDLIWEIVDPPYFKQAYQGQKAWLAAPDWELDEFVCEAITGEF